MNFVYTSYSLVEILFQEVSSICEDEERGHNVLTPSLFSLNAVTLAESLRL